MLLAVVGSAEQCSNTLSQFELYNKCCFLFSCPAYSDVRQKNSILFLQTFPVPDFLTNSKPNACGGFLTDNFSHRKPIVST